MARVNLSIPDDLKSKMDEIGAGVNWSNIARDAFSIIVASHLSRNNPNMETQIERLRAERKVVFQEDAENGFKTGQQAALHLQYRDLVKLCCFDTDAYERRLATNDICLRECLAAHIEIGEEDLFGETDVSETFAENFLKGAREILREVHKG